MAKEKKKIINTDVLFMPKIKSDKQKRQNIRDIRKNRRQSLRTAQSREEKQAIREEARGLIQQQRGGKTQVGEIIEDVQDTASQINKLRKNIQGTTLGQVIPLGMSISKNISSLNVKKLSKNAKDVVSLVTGKNKKGASVIARNSSGCNCDCQ
ncbi:MAG: hypothetical protein GOVbin3171_60 [Prokaryotic dsDNA virus sp.]|nr:MAG: hypothetical protein GOVbin3171_60 [Prokaryotic dsDNA virus sp.]|tara:strand:- start:9747 stop:10205 length:459 start_codon:yes stop_codon:yes gene_type:complete